MCGCAVATSMRSEIGQEGSLLPHITSFELPQETAKHLLSRDLTLWVNPERISKQIRKDVEVGSDIMQAKTFFDFFFVDGEWDLDTSVTPFESDRDFLEMRDLFHLGWSYQDSPSFVRCMSELESGKPRKDHNGIPFSSAESVDEYFRNYLQLFHSMSVRGYVPAYDLDGYEASDEIGVAITRTGQLLHFRTGHHRLAIAKLLQLSRVYVQIHLVHHKWLGTVGDSSQDEIIRTTRNQLRRLGRRESE